MTPWCRECDPPSPPNGETWDGVCFTDTQQVCGCGRMTGWVCVGGGDRCTSTARCTVEGEDRTIQCDLLDGHSGEHRWTFGTATVSWVTETFVLDTVLGEPEPDDFTRGFLAACRYAGWWHDSADEAERLAEAKKARDADQEERT
mgnify:CR=1 FL=1